MENFEAWKIWVHASPRMPSNCFRLSTNRTILDFIMIQISTFASLYFMPCSFRSMPQVFLSSDGVELALKNGGEMSNFGSSVVYQHISLLLCKVSWRFWLELTPTSVTSKSADDEDFGELYAFKWTTLLIPPTTVLIINLVGVVAGISDAINNGYQSWGPLFGKLFFAFWVIVHLYPFLKGLMGRQNRTPTIVVIWSILLASIFSLLWVRIDPFVLKTKGPDTKNCGINC